MRASGLLLAGAAALVPACRGPGEHVLGEATTLVIEGESAFEEEELYAAVEQDLFEVPEGPATRAEVDDAAYAVETFLRQQGFHFADVRYEYVPPGEEDDGAREDRPEGAKGVLHVEQGPRVALASLALEGNESYEDDTLRPFFVEHGGVLANGEKRFVRSRLQGGAKRLEDFYYQSGFLRARVAEPEVRFSDDRRGADVTVRIEEGPRFRLASIDFDVEGDDLPAELAGELREELESVYTPRVAYALRAEILEYFGRRGRPDATARFDASLDEEAGTASLSFRVEPGPLVTIADLRVVGNRSTDEDLILQRLALRPGERYDAEAVRESFSNLYRSGLFRSVRIHLGEGAASERDLVVEIDELPTVDLFVEPGYGSYEGARLSFGADERNLAGTGTALRFETAFSFKAQSATLDWTDPWIDRGRYRSRIGIFGNHREEPSFTFTEYGTRWGLTRLWSERLRSTGTYRFRRSELEDVDLDPDDPLLEDVLNDVNVSSIALSNVFDDRDDIFVPRRGTRAGVGVEWAGSALGSEIDFLATNLELATFFRVFRPSVLALSVRTAAKLPLADTESLPLQERYFNGGENTVRSFREDELGPKDSSGEPLGGEAYGVASVEWRQELLGNLSGALFLDAGNVVSDFEDWIDFPGVEVGLGAGLRYLLPIGPLRLDAGWNPNASGDEDDFVVHFSVGMPF